MSSTVPMPSSLVHNPPFFLCSSPPSPTDHQPITDRFNMDDTHKVPVNTTNDADREITPITLKHHDSEMVHDQGHFQKHDEKIKYKVRRYVHAVDLKGKNTKLIFDEDANELKDGKGESIVEYQDIRQIVMGRDVELEAPSCICSVFQCGWRKVYFSVIDGNGKESIFSVRNEEDRYQIVMKILKAHSVTIASDSEHDADRMSVVQNHYATKMAVNILEPEATDDAVEALDSPIEELKDVTCKELEDVTIEEIKENKKQQKLKKMMSNYMNEEEVTDEPVKAVQVPIERVKEVKELTIEEIEKNKAKQKRKEMMSNYMMDDR